METKKSLTNQQNSPSRSGVGRWRRTAADVKALRGRLDLADDLLKQIPIVDEGATLSQGAQYLDLSQPNAKPFTATAEDRAKPDQYLVDKADVHYEIWNHLTGQEKPGQEFHEGPTREARS